MKLLTKHLCLAAMSTCLATAATAQTLPGSGLGGGGGMSAGLPGGTSGGGNPGGGSCNVSYGIEGSSTASTGANPQFTTVATIDIGTTDSYGHKVNYTGDLILPAQTNNGVFVDQTIQIIEDIQAGLGSVETQVSGFTVYEKQYCQGLSSLTKSYHAGGGGCYFGSKVPNGSC